MHAPRTQPICVSSCRLENNCLRSFPRALGRSLTDLTDLNLARNQISSPPFSFENLAGLKVGVNELFNVLNVERMRGGGRRKRR